MSDSNNIKYFFKTVLKSALIAFWLYFFLLILIPPPQFIRNKLLMLLNNPNSRVYILSLYNNPYVFIKLYEYDMSNNNSELAYEDLNLALGVCDKNCFYYDYLMSLKKQDTNSIGIFFPMNDSLK